MSTSTATLPPAVLPSASRAVRQHEPLSIDDLAKALRGMPRDAAFWVDTPDGVRPVVGITPGHVRTGAGGPEASLAGACDLVLRLGGTLPLAAAGAGSPQPFRTVAEDRYRTVLQAIARGRPDGSRAMAGTEVQALARELLVELGEDWPRPGTPTPA